MSKPKRAKWPPIYKQLNRNNQPTYYVDLRAVEAGRPGFPTLAEARNRAEQARIGRANEGNSAFTMPMGDRLDAIKAMQILEPRKWSLHQAAEWIKKHVFAYLDAPPVKEVVSRYLKEAESRNLRPRTIGDLEHRLNTFADDFGDAKLSEITLDELREWIMDEEWEPRTRINFATKISQLYNYAIRHKWTESNLAASIERPLLDDTTPEIYTVEEAKKLLENANEFGLLPYVAIGLFAGVRSAEQIRLAGTAINFNTKAIVIGSDVAKKRGQRIIEMNDTLIAWLTPAKAQLENGVIYSDSSVFRANKAKLLDKVGMEWKPNALRHSFGSYHLAMNQNIEQTAHLMGNSADMIHRHYKQLVPKEEAEKFWALRPPTLAQSES